MDMFMPRLIIVCFSLLIFTCLGMILWSLCIQLSKGDPAALFLIGFFLVAGLITGIWTWIVRERK